MLSMFGASLSWFLCCTLRSLNIQLAMLFSSAATTQHTRQLLVLVSWLPSDSQSCAQRQPSVSVSVNTTSQPNFYFVARVTQASGSCFLLTAEPAFSFLEYVRTEVCAPWSVCATMGIAIYWARGLRAIDWIGVFSGTLGRQTLHACHIIDR